MRAASRAARCFARSRSSARVRSPSWADSNEDEDDPLATPGALVVVGTRFLLLFLRRDLDWHALHERTPPRTRSSCAVVPRAPTRQPDAADASVENGCAADGTPRVRQMRVITRDHAHRRRRAGAVAARASPAS